MTSAGTIQLDASASSPGDASPAAPRRRFPAGIRDVLLVVLGAALALVVEEWRDSRAESRRTVLAMTSIRAELVDNRSRVERARAHHLSMADTLGGYVSRGQVPPEVVYFSGVFQPALPLSMAWQTARETGALAGLPYAVVLAVAPVYEAQERYRELSDALAQATLIDMQRRGALAVFRDEFSHFIPLERDFANREQVLARAYGLAIARLDSVRRAGVR